MLNEMKYFVGRVYKVDPATIVMNTRFVDFNPVHSESELVATAKDIERNGQQKPIYMLSGECIDGRHRCRVLSELGREVVAIDVKEGLSDDTYLQLCNTETIAGRNLTPTQRAVSAYNYKERVGCTSKEAAETFQVTAQNLTYANKIASLNMPEVLDRLLEGKTIQLKNMDKASKSLEYICKMAKELSEVTIVEDTSERIQFNPDAFIRTEVGKVWYYDKVNSLGLNSSSVYNSIIRQDYAELANYKFREMGS